MIYNCQHLYNKGIGSRIWYDLTFIKVTRIWNYEYLLFTSQRLVWVYLIFPGSGQQILDCRVCVISVIRCPCSIRIISFLIALHCMHENGHLILTVTLTTTFRNSCRCVFDFPVKRYHLYVFFPSIDWSVRRRWSGRGGHGEQHPRGTWLGRCNTPSRRFLSLVMLRKKLERKAAVNVKVKTFHFSFTIMFQINSPILSYVIKALCRKGHNGVVTCTVKL